MKRLNQTETPIVRNFVCSLFPKAILYFLKYFDILLWFTMTSGGFNRCLHWFAIIFSDFDKLHWFGMTSDGFESLDWFAVAFSGFSSLQWFALTSGGFNS